MMTRSIRAALPSIRDTDLCEGACAFEAVHGRCESTCHVVDMISRGTKAHARVTKPKPKIDAAEIYRERARPPAKTTSGAAR